MKNIFYLVCLSALISCQGQTKQKVTNTKQETSADFIVSFGSCNNQTIKNEMWVEIVKHKPNVWVWGGDVIYSDTHDMTYMKMNFDKQKSKIDYQNFLKKVPVIGTWDDHDYGLNDGGTDYPEKRTVQQLFLDFLDVDSTDVRRSRPGVYFSKIYTIGSHSVNIIVLDTRYFRTHLTKDKSGKKRYVPNTYGEGTMLGSTQWQWLKNKLDNSKADFNIIESSIQFLSHEHGFEAWGNMPHEVVKLKKIIAKSKAKGVIILSGDRHIAEISKTSIENMTYPLIDITSSGMTHSYSSFKSEPNEFRVSEVVAEKNFGLIKFNFKKRTALFELRGAKNILYQTYTQQY